MGYEWAGRVGEGDGGGGGGGGGGGEGGWGSEWRGHEKRVLVQDMHEIILS